MIYNVFGCAVHSKLRSSRKEEAKPNMFMVAIFYSYLNWNAHTHTHAYTLKERRRCKCMTTVSKLRRQRRRRRRRQWWCRCKRMEFSLSLSLSGFPRVLAETAEIIIIKCYSNETNGISYMNTAILLPWRCVYVCVFTRQSITYLDSHFSAPVKYINKILNIYSQITNDAKKKKKKMYIHWANYVAITSKTGLYRNYTTYIWSLPIAQAFFHLNY